MKPLDTVRQQFNKMIEKEGRTLHFETGECKAIVRGANSNSSQEHITIYYSQDEGINKGDVFELAGEHFLIINKKAWDSETFYESYCTRTNHDWRINGKTYHMVSGDLASPNPKNGTIVTVNGAITMFTSQSEIMWIDDVIYDFTGQYKCVNKFDIDGISYYYFQREVANTNAWHLERLGADNEVAVGNTINCEYFLKQITSEGFNIAPAAKILYTSSDPSIATVDEFGQVTGISEGTVTITASTTLTEGKKGFQGFTHTDYSETLAVTVISAPTPTNPYSITVTYSGVNNQMRVGGSQKRFTAHLIDNVNNVEIPLSYGEVTFSYTPTGLDVEETSETELDTAGMVGYRLPSTEDNRQLIGRDFVVTATHDTYNISGNVTCGIVG